MNIKDIESLIAPLVWSEDREPCEDCRYDHTIADTPLGRFLISWKSWKQWDSPTIDETPFGGWYAVCDDVASAKECAETYYKKKILSVFSVK